MLTIHATRRSRIVLVPFTIAACLLPACGAAPAEVPNGDDTDLETGTVTSALSTDLCTLVKGLGTALKSLTVGGAVQVNTLNCDHYKTDNVFFHGAGQLDHTLNDLFILPFVTTGAYYCALGDADAASVDGTIHAAGGFGASSQFDVYQRDPSTLTIKARKSTTISLFGAGVRLGVQDITITLPSENSSDNNWWGGHMHTVSDGTPWDMDVQATFPVGPLVVTVRPQLHMRSPTGFDANGALSLQSFKNGAAFTDLYNVWNSGYWYPYWHDCIVDSTCLHPRSRVSDSELIADHAQACPASIASTTDHILPYKNPFGGALCGGMPEIYLDATHNFFEFGHPAGTPMANEPDYTLKNPADVNDPHQTFSGALEVAATYGLDFASINVDATATLTSREGFALRQRSGTVTDANPMVDVYTQLSAESRANMHLAISVQITDWLPPITLSFDFPFTGTGDREAFSTGTRKITEIMYAQQAHTSFQSYTVKDVPKTDADGARGACLNVPAASKSPPAPGDPAKFVNDVAKGFVDNFHPCNVQTCDHNLIAGKNYKWNKTTKHLDLDPTVTTCTTTCTKTAQGCYMCPQFAMDLCDANGNVVSQSPHITSQPILRPGCTR